LSETIQQLEGDVVRQRDINGDWTLDEDASAAWLLHPDEEEVA
jgi:hypothetical protein